MTRTLEEVLADVNQIVRGVLRDPAVQLRYETMAKEVKNWDSLNHIEIILAIEKHFGMKFNFAELQKFKNVGHLCDSIVQRAAQR